MEQLETILNEISSQVWGVFMLAMLLGIGVYLTFGLKFFTFRKVTSAIIMLWQGRKSDQEGDITPFQALMTALSATIGTGNIAGVATAIALGGPGAVFWMWLTALFGMATKYAEALLAVEYRETDDQGLHVGGPMYYIKNGLKGKWNWLAVAFAFFGAFAAFGIGNMVQANSVADAVQTLFQVPPLYTAIILTLLSAVVILGGINRIAEVAAGLVPIMAISYIICALVVIFMHYQEIPHALGLILKGAFSGTAAVGGFTGAAVWAAIRFGVARGIFSNEAGLGSAPIAHAAAKTNDPVQQGMIAMLGTFIDTILVCTMTALVIILSGAWSSGVNGAALSTLAFETSLPGIGSYVVVLGLVVFAFTTILGWSYYGERCAEYLFGTKVIWPYRFLWLCAIPVGAMSKLTIVWLVADILNGLMAIPNLIALVLLSPVIFRMTSHYLRTHAENQGNVA
ncbi:alanine or glycine:cation symporter, AGCS family [Bathymodiolus platifrons methanotrophic gill symbiont]|uniref:alanine/glycine:cation symporter family protein n=1 Tax=Bathymodiolus platifrons methanotrophic gill symbiont TaxID=113268 RepID=UPI0011C6F9A8|nr:sodium:alanine symporter family protein [Bathymodiolus platifrons methanotrophic gill symbiont]TXL18567.1 sodium:alanine symporter family protein [Methylococcaceae bacterium HT3]GFO75293.1 alanine or glycine:cation symporter, AGCS family [Bathymodiolus platifrons methanotrophic gill symbiont]